MERKIMINKRLLLDASADELWYKAKAADKHYIIVKIENRLSKLLYLFAEKNRQVISREELIEKIWYGNANVGNPGLTKAISKLRKILKQFAFEKTELIETLPKKGYRLNADTKVIIPEAELASNLPMPTRNSWLKRAAVIFILAVTFMLLKIILSGGMHQIMHHAGH